MSSVFEPARKTKEPVRRPGRVRSVLLEAGAMVEFTTSTVRALPGVPRFTAEVFRQAAILVRGSTFVIAAMTLFIGMTQVNFAYFFLRAAGASDFTGLFSGLTTPRAAVPIMFGYVFAAKVGGGLAAEIGAMRISEEIDALEVEGVNPMSYLVGTRLVGALLFTPIAVCVALLAGTAGSYFQAIPVLQGITSGGFLHYHWGVQNLNDQLLSFLNLTTQAVVVVLVSCFYGYRAAGGPASVGSAVARSLLVNIVLVHIIAAFYILVFYGQDPKLPIGG
jgi:phospholipid/cholesterol/gamma-HCH transport system permease protein